MFIKGFQQFPFSTSTMEKKKKCGLAFTFKMQINNTCENTRYMKVHNVQTIFNLLINIFIMC